MVFRIRCVYVSVFLSSHVLFVGEVIVVPWGAKVEVVFADVVC